MKNKWKPIETATKTSRHVMLFGDAPSVTECCYVGYWDTYRGKWCGIPGHAPVGPTHWKSIPKAPRGEEE